MRWFVEISSLGQGAQPGTKVCVDAPQWQPALQKARALRGDHGALSNFSIELLDDGYRAIDPATRTRYLVRRAPDDAALTEPAAAEAAKEPAREAVPFGRARAETMQFSSKGAAAIREAIAQAEPEPMPAPRAAASAPAPAPARARAKVVDFQVVSTREDNPSERSPLTYREVVYAVAPGTSEDLAGALLLDRFEGVRRSIEEIRPGKLVNLAVFDHVFQGRPSRRPLATLAWKDWRSTGPVVHYPLRDTEVGSGPSGPLSPSTPPPVPSQPPREAEAAAVAPTTVAAAPEQAKNVSLATIKGDSAPKNVSLATAKVAVAAEAPSVAAKKAAVASEGALMAAKKAVVASEGALMAAKKAVVASEEAPMAAKKAAVPGERPLIPLKTPAAAPSPPAVAPPPAAPRARLSGDDLIGELFEACSDLHFLRDALEGADFVLALTLEKIPCDVGMVSLFDIDRREFVVVRQTGGQSAVLTRLPESFPLAQAAMRSRRAVVVPDAAADKRVLLDRWKKAGAVPRSVLCAPVELAGRTLGLIEIADPADGGRFTGGDGNALTYIGQQFAEFLADRGVIVDPEQVGAAAPAKKGAR